MKITESKRCLCFVCRSVKYICLTFLCYILLFVHFRALLNIVFNSVGTVFLCVGCPSTWSSFISGIGMSMNSILEFMKFRIHGHSYNLSPP